MRPNSSTNLRNRVKKLYLPKTKALYPLFEIISNSIHAIDEKKVELNDQNFKGKIEIKIIRNGSEEILKKLKALIAAQVTFRTFFDEAKIHPNAHLIKGVVCGYRIEEIEEEFELYKQCRQMEKLIDELAKGRKLEKILREEKK